MGNTHAISFYISKECYLLRKKSFLAIYFNEVSDYDDYPSRYEGYGDKEEQGYGWAAPQSRRGGRTGGYY